VIGTCSNITVGNTTTGESISIDASLGADDTLVIDCRPATRDVTLNGTSNLALKTTAGWISCDPGDNTMTFTRNSLEAVEHCSISLYARWI
jgi:Mrp family chromosome partitioning ATPase